MKFSLPFLGVGYRARYLIASARQVLANGGAPWLLALRDAPYEDAKSTLLTLIGVGEKIADCVALFSLDKDNAIPVDTHVRQIAERLYLHGAAPKSLTKNGYALITDTIRNCVGLMAGWAQQYFFYADTFEKGLEGRTRRSTGVSTSRHSRLFGYHRSRQRIRERRPHASGPAPSPASGCSIRRSRDHPWILRIEDERGTESEVLISVW